MFSYQREFRLPTETVTQQLLRQLVGSPQTRWLTKEHRRWRENMPSILADAELQEQWAKDEEFQKWCIDQENDHHFVRKGVTRAQAFKAMTLPQRLQGYCDYLKKSLPFVIFIATYDESESAKSKKMGRWRNQKYCRLNGLCVIDFDHVEGDVRKVWEEAYAKLSDEDKARILFVFVTPSGHGLKVVFIADAAIGNLIDNQIVFSKKLGLNPDEACKDASRGAFLTTNEDIIFIDEEKLITYENEDFGKKYNDEYHAGHSQPTIDVTKIAADNADMAAVQGTGENQQGLSGSNGGNVRDAESLMYNGVSYTKIIEAWLDGKDLTNNRHNTLVELANHLRYLCGKNATQIEKVVMQLPWVQDLAAEGENVSSTINSVIEFKYYERMPKKLKEALEKVGALEQKVSVSADAADDIYAMLPLDKWAEELQEMAEFYPCMKELFLNVHPHKLPAVLFSSAALFGTLMTRAWYHFWYEPELIRRLNYCVFACSSSVTQVPVKTLSRNSTRR